MTFECKFVIIPVDTGNVKIIVAPPFYFKETSVHALHLQVVSPSSCFVFEKKKNRSASQSSGDKPLKGRRTFSPSRKYGKMTLGITRVKCHLGTLWCEGLLSYQSQVRKFPAFPHFYPSCCFCEDFHWSEVETPAKISATNRTQKDQWKIRCHSMNS